MYVGITYFLFCRQNSSTVAYFHGQ